MGRVGDFGDQKGTGMVDLRISIMSAVDVHKWLRMDLSQRQELVRRFFSTNDTELAKAFLSLVKASRSYGIYASIGPNYQYAVFGRDSIEVAEDLLETQPGLAREIILVLSHLQGTRLNLISEEERGKIHHEYRARYLGGSEVPKAAQTVLDVLKTQWGGSEDELLYYGSFDATPLFIRLVHRYCRQEGVEILDQVVVGRDKAERTVREHVRMAAMWLTDKVTASPWRLFEYRRLNPEGLFNQGWEDSKVAYLHADGTLVNADSGVAAVELQGYAYDALRAAAELVAEDDEEAEAWRHLASILRDNTLELLWMEDEQYFALGLDRDDDGKTRQIRTLNADAALLLDTDMLSLLPRHQAWPYIEGIVRKLFSADFVTPVGFRLRALRHAQLVSFADYHGSLVSWPKETHDVAKGLHRHGFYTLAHLLEASILQAVGKAGEFYEFFLVDVHGRPKYHYRIENPDEPSFHDFGAADTPEPGQAWTISAVLSIVRHWHNPQAEVPVEGEVRSLEQQLLKKPRVVALAEQARAEGGLR